MQTEEILEEVDPSPESDDSVEDSVRRAIEELEAKSGEANSEPFRDEAPPEIAAETVNPDTVDAKTEGEAQEKVPQVEDYQPPQNWTVEGKEFFNKLPVEAKREYSRVSRELESHATKLYQDLNRGISEVGEVKQILDHYRPKWGLQGLTDAQAIAQLAAANDIIRTDPVQGISLLMQSTGVTVEQLSGVPKENRQAAAPQADPVLLSKISELQQWKEKHETAEFEQRASRIAAELSEVVNARDQSGRYLYPKLHDSTYLQRVQQLVSALKETNPGLSWGECMKRAYITTEGGSPSFQQPRLTPAAQQRTNLERAKQASVSARLRGGSRAADLSAVDPQESIEDSVRLAIRMAERG